MNNRKAGRLYTTVVICWTQGMPERSKPYIGTFFSVHTCRCVLKFKLGHGKGLVAATTSTATVTMHWGKALIHHEEEQLVTGWCRQERAQNPTPCHQELDSLARMGAEVGSRGLPGGCGKALVRQRRETWEHEGRDFCVWETPRIEAWGRTKLRRLLGQPTLGSQPYSLGEREKQEWLLRLQGWAQGILQTRAAPWRSGWMGIKKCCDFISIHSLQWLGWTQTPCLLGLASVISTKPQAWTLWESASEPPPPPQDPSWNRVSQLGDQSEEGGLSQPLSWSYAHLHGQSHWNQNQPPARLCIWEPWLRLLLDWQEFQMLASHTLMPRGCLRSRGKGQGTHQRSPVATGYYPLIFLSQVIHFCMAYQCKIFFRALN
jgi:hypothetical protein